MSRAIDIKTFDAFISDVLPTSEGWAFYDHWYVPGTHPPTDLPPRAVAEDWLFVRSGQDCFPFWTSTESREWTTWDGPADVGYVAVTTTWSVAAEVEWNGVRYVRVGPLLVGDKFEPTLRYEVFRPVNRE